MATWDEKQQALLKLPNVTWVSQVQSFVSPSPGKLFTLNEMRFMAQRSRDLEGIVLGIGPSRAHCAVVVEGPADSAVAVVAKSPTVLETLVPRVFEILGPAYVPHFCYLY